MCRAKKSREAYEALGAATEEIESEQTERVPERLKNKQLARKSGSVTACDCPPLLLGRAQYLQSDRTTCGPVLLNHPVDHVAHATFA